MPLPALFEPPQALPEASQAQDEVSLRDLYVILKRWRVLIVALTLIPMIATLLVCLILPRVYVSKVTLSLGLNSQSVGGSGITAQLLTNLPSLAGLAQGFTDLMTTKIIADQLNESDPDRKYTARFLEKQGLFVLTARGDSSLEALKNAQRFSEVAKGYFKGRLVLAVISNLESLLSRSRLDIGNMQENLKRLQLELKNTPTETRTIEALLPSSGSGGRANGALSARGTSPAFATLSVQEATLRAGLAQAKALIEALESIQGQRGELDKVIGQALQLQELVPAAEPLRPDQPKPLLYTLIAGALGLLVSLLVPFVIEALREPRLV
jgi:uncharacterized protein involved in exopolysaccharide biosynthesis